MPKTKGFEEKRGARFSVSVGYSDDEKLNKLAVSCGMSKSELVDYITSSAINSSDYVKRIQDRFNKNPNYRVIPVVENGKMRYV